MKTVKVLPHTADVRLLVEGSTSEELFEAAMEGMAGLIKDSLYELKKGKPVNDSIEVESPDRTALLIDFLSSVLTTTHQKNAVFTKVNFEKLNDKSLTATISGFETDGFDDDIKAVTYHEAEIKKNKNGNLETIIVFDI
ncbi:MAG TPA: archease [candidate division Zixibacteria bacterium]|nr:archease [candidate division Zixibacteria bacterium]